MSKEGLELTSVGAAQPAQPSHAHHAHKATVTPFAYYAFLLQVSLIILFGTCCTWATGIRTTVAPSVASGSLDVVQWTAYFGTHSMMLIGFGFLYTGIRTYAWTGLSQTLLTLAIVAQLAVLLNGGWEAAAAANHGKANAYEAIPLNLGSFIRSNYSAAAVLISLGAVLGRVSHTQMLIIMVVEVIFTTLSETICVHELETRDAGGSFLIHTIGASFGLALSWVLGDKPKKAPVTSKNNALFAMIGTAFLFVFWPAFNAAMLTGSAASRAAVSTILSIACSAVATFIVGSMLSPGNKFEMEDIQNAVLAGGVSIGAACDMLSGSPWGAMLTGFVAGGVSTYGFHVFTPALKEKGLTDTCGILNLHFLPGIIGGTASAIAAGTIKIGSGSEYWSTAAVEEMFPAMKSVAAGGHARTALQQGGYQMAATLISMAFGIGAGLLAGWLAKKPAFCPLKDEQHYEDEAEWSMHAAVEEAEAGKVAKQLQDELAQADAKMQLRIRAIIKEEMAAAASGITARGVAAIAGAVAAATGKERNATESSVGIADGDSPAGAAAV